MLLGPASNILPVAVVTLNEFDQQCVFRQSIDTMVAKSVPQQQRHHN